MNTLEEAREFSRQSRGLRDPEPSNEFVRQISDEASGELSGLGRQLFRETSNGVVVYQAVDGGRDFSILDLNQAVERIEAIKRHEVLGRRVTEIFPGVAALGLLSVLRRVWSSGKREHLPLAQYADDRIRGWRENRVFRLAGGEVVAIYDDRTHEVEIEQAEARHELLAKELNHRLLNAAHVVELIVRQSLKDEPSRARIINQRIRAGLAGFGIRERAATKPTSMRRLLDHELAPFGRDRFRLEGPELPLLPAHLRTIVTLMAHELATNAIKHGALSNTEGRVSINWRPTTGLFKLSWREHGGPSVKPPTRRGYGAELLRRLIDGIGGSLEMAFPREGFRAQITLPRRPVSERAQAPVAVSTHF